jgi:anaerobic magnesium-protoporphyrin IX monomethyl ester cyclase
MDISLIVPNLMSSKTFLQPPVGLCSVAAHLRSSGHEVHLFDFRASNTDLYKAIALIPEETQLCVVTTSPYDMTQMYHSDYRFEYSLKFINKLKEARPSLIVGLCGAHGTLKPDLVMSQTSADVLIRWEIDQVLPLIVRALESKETIDSIPNLAFSRAGDLCTTAVDQVLAHPQLNDVEPLPAWDLVDFSKYFGYQLDQQGKYKRLDRWGVILGSRGCPFACSFCHNFFGRKVRYRSPIIISDEFAYLAKTHHLNSIFFLDSNFTLNREWALDICEELCSRNTNVSWICQTRCDLVDEELLHAMKEANCTSIQFGIESFNDHVLHALNKEITTDTILKAIDLCKQVDITPGGFLMVGTPFDNETSIQDTINLLKREEIPFIPIIYTPRFGSVLGDSVCADYGVKDWKGMLSLRGKIASQYALSSMVDDHARLRGQSFGTSPTNFFQPNLRNATDQHRKQIFNMIELGDTDKLVDSIIQPSQKITMGLKPFISFPVTSNCCFKCLYCGNGGENTISPATEFDLATLMDLSIVAKNKGITKVRLTGGEPTMHPDFGDIVRFLAEQKFYVLVNTNGAWIKRKRAELLRPSSNIHFAVSLDTLREDRFNEISRSKGYFGTVMHGIEILRDLGLLMRINMVVGQFNKDEVDDMITFCRSLDCDLKLQEIASVPYPHNDWEKTHQGLEEIDKELLRRSDKVLMHRYASSFGIPVRVYLIDDVYVTVKALHHGSRFELEGLCKGCPHFPCHEGLYDIYVLGDGSIAPCRWRRLGDWKTFGENLECVISAFQKAQHLGKGYIPKPMYRVAEKLGDKVEFL